VYINTIHRCHCAQALRRCCCKRDYYYREARWIEGLMLGVVVAGALTHVVVEGRLDVTGARAVRLAMAAILIPGILTLNPRVHAAQAVLLALVILFAVSYVAKPLG
jgi:lysylphosphatidylglycerol synthetase-like protein (DUF2156 family)